MAVVFVIVAVEVYFSLPVGRALSLRAEVVNASPSPAASGVASGDLAAAPPIDQGLPLSGSSSPGATALPGSALLSTPAASRPASAARSAAASSGGASRATTASKAGASRPSGAQSTSTPRPKPTKTPSVKPPSSPTRVSINKAIAYFRSAQLTQGGFGPSGQTASMTPWVVQAIAATGADVSGFKRSGGRSPIAYLQSLDIDGEALSGSGATRNPANVYTKMIIAYRAAGASSSIKAAGSKRIDLVSRLLAYKNSQSGAFSATQGGASTYAAISTTSWAVIALKAARVSSSQYDESVSWLARQQESNGGFSFTPGGAPDADSTAAAVQALRAGGVAASSPTIKRAIAYLHTQQMTNGGFVSGMGAATNAESTAWAVQAIRAAGQNPAGAAWKKGGKTPIAFLLSLQSGSGAFYHYGTTLAAPLLTTSQVVIALSGKTYPL